MARYQGSASQHRSSFLGDVVETSSIRTKVKINFKSAFYIPSLTSSAGTSSKCFYWFIYFTLLLFHDSLKSMFSSNHVGRASHGKGLISNQVGVLIGRSGETIKNLQFNLGAKIQTVRDAEVDPLSLTRLVEIIVTPENIDKAKRLIRDVISEADARRSPALMARGFGSVQSGGEYIEMLVPNEKVGMIIGKGGDAVKNLQTKSGTRVQLIPQHLPVGDTSTERVVRIIGHKFQIESAREMVKEVMNKL